MAQLRYGGRNLGNSRRLGSRPRASFGVIPHLLCLLVSRGGLSAPQTLAIDELDGRPPLDLAILGVTDPVVPPPIHTRFETTYLAGLRKAGLPEE